MISSKSSSLHTISCDNRPSFLKHALWLLLNFFLNNLNFFFKKDKNLGLEYFHNNNAYEWLKKINTNNTPIRLACDLFWYNIPVNYIVENLKEIKVLDIGCGRGIYYNILKEIFGTHFKSYTGFDKKLRVSQDLRSKKDAKFIEDDVKNIQKYLDGHNLIISQSFIEHIKYDIKFFEDLKYLESAGKPIMQIHVFPSRLCLYSYLGHGIRHYNIRNVSKLTKCYSKKFTTKNLIALGSKNLNNYQLVNFTLTRIMRKKNILEKDLQKYINEVALMLNRDNRLNKDYKIKNAASYALVLQSNFKNLK